MEKGLNENIYINDKTVSQISKINLEKSKVDKGLLFAHLEKKCRV